MGFGVASQPTFSVASPALLLRLQLLLWQLRCRRAIGGLDGLTAARTSMHDAPHDALAARSYFFEIKRTFAQIDPAKSRAKVPRSKRHVTLRLCKHEPGVGTYRYH